MYWACIKSNIVKTSGLSKAALNMHVNPTQVSLPPDPLNTQINTHGHPCSLYSRINPRMPKMATVEVWKESPTICRMLRHGLKWLQEHSQDHTEIPRRKFNRFGLTRQDIRELYFPTSLIRGQRVCTDSVLRGAPAPSRSPIYVRGNPLLSAN